MRSRVREGFRSLLIDHGEKVRFLFVGMWNTLFSILMYNIALAAAKPLIRRLASAEGMAGWAADHGYIIMFWVVWVVAVVHSTATMKYFAFRDSGAFWRQIPRSYVIYLPAQAISTVVLWASVQILGFIPQVGQLVAVFITTIFSYIGHKYYTFASVEQIPEGPDGRP